MTTGKKKKAAEIGKIVTFVFVILLLFFKTAAKSSYDLNYSQVKISKKRKSK